MVTTIIHHYSAEPWVKWVASLSSSSRPSGLAANLDFRGWDSEESLSTMQSSLWSLPALAAWALWLSVTTLKQSIWLTRNTIQSHISFTLLETVWLTFFFFWLLRCFSVWPRVSQEAPSWLIQCSQEPHKDRTYTPATALRDTSEKTPRKEVSETKEGNP